MTPWLIALVLLPVALIAGEREDRIRAVEAGLLQPVRIAGVPPWTLQHRMRELAVPGVSIAVWKEYALDWTRGYGVKDVESGEPVTDATLFQAASISKPVAATVALKIVESGGLDLDGDINRTLVSWKLPENEFTRRSTVTLRRLLSHSAGLTVRGFPGYGAGREIPTIVQVLDGEPPANTPPVRVDIEPGTMLRYAGGGTTVMQLALMDLTGRTFPELARATVLEPAGMTSSTYEQPLPPGPASRAASGHRRDGAVVEGRWHVYPEMAAAGLWTTSADLARFAIDIQRAHRGDTGRVLSPAMARTMLTPVIEDAAHGFFIEQHGSAVYFQHGGANEGFRSGLVASRDGGYGAAVMVNSDNGAILSEILRAVADVYEWEEYLEEPLTPVRLEADRLERFAGTFLVHEDRIITLRRDGGTLAASEEPWTYRLYPLTPVEFARPDRRSRYVFGGRTGTSPDTLLIRDRVPATAVRVAGSYTTPRQMLDGGDRERAADAYRRIRRVNPGSEAVDEARLNALGYEYLGRGRTAEAITVFRLNVEFFPESWNTYDSLGEAYAAAGERDRAIDSYRRSVELNPENENGRRALHRLESGR